MRDESDPIWTTRAFGKRLDLFARYMIPQNERATGTVEVVQEALERHILLIRIDHLKFTSCITERDGLSRIPTAVVRIFASIAGFFTCVISIGGLCGPGSYGVQTEEVE